MPDDDATKGRWLDEGEIDECEAWLCGEADDEMAHDLAGMARRAHDLARENAELRARAEAYDRLREEAEAARSWHGTTGMKVCKPPRFKLSTALAIIEALAGPAAAEGK